MNSLTSHQQTTPNCVTQPPSYNSSFLLFSPTTTHTHTHTLTQHQPTTTNTPISPFFSFFSLPPLFNSPKTLSSHSFFPISPFTNFHISTHTHTSTFWLAMCALTRTKSQHSTCSWTTCTLAKDILTSISPHKVIWKHPNSPPHVLITQYLSPWYLNHHAMKQQQPTKKKTKKTTNSRPLLNQIHHNIHRTTQ